jgi:hypothetical protein
MDTLLLTLSLIVSAYSLINGLCTQHKSNGFIPYEQE